MNLLKNLAGDASVSEATGSGGAGRGGASPGEGAGCAICKGGNGLMGSWGGFFFFLLLKPPLEDFTTSLKNLSNVWARAPMLTITMNGGAKSPVNAPLNGESCLSEEDTIGLLFTSGKGIRDFVFGTVAALVIPKLMTKRNSIFWKEE